MSTKELEIKRMEIFREVLDINDEKILTNLIVEIHNAKRYETLNNIPPDGFMTGDEFERRVKARVTKFYQDNGLL